MIEIDVIKIKSGETVSGSTMTSENFTIALEK